MAKMTGVLYSMFGLVVDTIFSLIALIGAALGHPIGPYSGLTAVVLGVGSVILFPILCWVFGFLAGLLNAAIYNMAARLFGGIEFEGVQTNS
jgi:hypothetical protein